MKMRAIHTKRDEIWPFAGCGGILLRCTVPTWLALRMWVWGVRPPHTNWAENRDPTQSHCHLCIFFLNDTYLRTFFLSPEAFPLFPRYNSKKGQKKRSASRQSVITPARREKVHRVRNSYVVVACRSSYFAWKRGSFTDKEIEICASHQQSQPCPHWTL